MMQPLFERAMIAGVGLIGGSLAAAGKTAGLFGSVIGFGRGRANLETALREGLVDEITTDIITAADGADLFVAATPVQSIVDVSMKAAEHLAPGCVMTDAGSVKRRIVDELEARLPSPLRFVGGHPVSGTEKSGAAAAYPLLFENRYAILTPTENTDDEALEQVRTMWKGVGSDVAIMDPGEHDEVMAVISHLPHFAAYALVETILEADASGAIQRFVAGGFKDTTRIAASDPAMWRDIFSMNKDRLLASIEKFERSLAAFRKNIIDDDFDAIERRLSTVRDARRAMEDHCD